MKLRRIEVFNFRKLRRARLDMSDKQTLLVGANNSGKTSAMKALRKFLKDRGGIDTRDVTASNWAAIEQIAGAWTQEVEVDLSPLLAQLPFIDVWLHADTSELHHVAHLIPTLTWLVACWACAYAWSQRGGRTSRRSTWPHERPLRRCNPAAQRPKGSRFGHVTFENF